MNAAVYARYSSDLQSPTSIEDQVRKCRGYADERGWTVLDKHIFVDRALSGTHTGGRGGLQALVELAMSGDRPFQAVLVEDHDRLSRDLGDTMQMFKQFEFHGIELVSVSDKISSRQSGAKIHMVFKGLMAEQFIENLREKTHRGLAGQVHRGYSAGGQTYGYSTEPVFDGNQTDSRGQPKADGYRMAINGGEAAVVIAIFKMRAEGLGPARIAARLNEQGIPSSGRRAGKGGRTWSAGTIYHMLKNEKYRGVFIWNKRRFVKDPNNGKRVARARPKNEWIIDEREELRIVPEELWIEAQAFRSNRGRKPGQASGRKHAGSRHLLSGVLKCGQCDGSMIAQGTYKGRDGTRKARFMCRDRYAKGKTVCTNGHGMKQEVIEKIVLDVVRQRLLRPQALEHLVRAANRRLDTPDTGRPRRLDALRDKLKAEMTRQDHLVEFIARGRASDAVADSLAATEDRIAQLEHEIEHLGRPPESVSRLRIDQGIAKAWLRNLDLLLATDKLGARRHLQRLIKEVRLHPHKDDDGRVSHDIEITADPAIVLANLVAGTGFEPATFGL